MGKSQSTRSRTTETRPAEPDAQIHETRTWRVRWEIDIEATSAEEAAVQMGGDPLEPEDGCGWGSCA